METREELLEVLQEVVDTALEADDLEKQAKQLRHHGQTLIREVVESLYRFLDPELANDEQQRLVSILLDGAVLDIEVKHYDSEHQPTFVVKPLAKLKKIAPEPPKDDIPF